jgi:hypothetical protein
MTFAQRQNRLTTHFSESIPAINRSISVVLTVWGGDWLDASASLAAVESRMTEHCDNFISFTEVCQLIFTIISSNISS